MEIIAVAKSVRMGPRKVRLVAEAIKHLPLDDAMFALQNMDKRAATPVAKALKSAVANAINNANLEKDNLQIASINITQGQALKRFRPSTRGRIHPYKKRSSNIRIVLTEKQKGGNTK
jgi:large subunit ribosomal protein L22